MTKCSKGIGSGSSTNIFLCFLAGKLARVGATFSENISHWFCTRFNNEMRIHQLKAFMEQFPLSSTVDVMKKCHVVRELSQGVLGTFSVCFQQGFDKETCRICPRNAESICYLLVLTESVMQACKGIGSRRSRRIFHRLLMRIQWGRMKAFTQISYMSWSGSMKELAQESPMTLI